MGQDLVARFEVVAEDSVYAGVESLISGGEEVDRMMAFHGLEKLEESKRRKIEIDMRQKIEDEVTKIIAENIPVQNPH